MLLHIVAHTPKWVWLLLTFLIALGIRQTRDRTVKKHMILPLPTVMLFLSYYGVATIAGSRLTPFGLWLFGLVAITYLVATYMPLTGIYYDSDTETLRIAGSWLPFWFIMAIFTTKYVVGATTATQPSVTSNLLFVAVLGLVYGVLSGVLVGRAVQMWRVMSPQQALPKKAASTR